MGSKDREYLGQEVGKSLSRQQPGVEDTFSGDLDDDLTPRHPNQNEFVLPVTSLVFKREQMSRKLGSQVHVSSIATITVLKKD